MKTKEKIYIISKTGTTFDMIFVRKARDYFWVGFYFAAGVAAYIGFFVALVKYIVNPLFKFLGL